MRRSHSFLVGGLMLLAVAGSLPMTDSSAQADDAARPANADAPQPPEGRQFATFGSGCFWCSEAVFLRLKGVEKVVSGYSGGKVVNPTYEQVCTGRTGHAEVIQVTYDPSVITFAELLEVFWKTHDPTTLNRQGPDRGTQYRSVIFYHDEEQKREAEHYKQKLDESDVFPKKIVTQIVAFERFWPAEDYHQNYFALNAFKNPYCQAVVLPKVQKFEQVFRDKLRNQPAR